MDNVLKKGASKMWCDNCDQLTCSTNTTYRTTKKGKSIVIQHCSICKMTLETEVVRGPHISITNTNKKKRSK